MTLTERTDYRIEAEAAPDFLRHVHWSAQPEVTLFETGTLPVVALRHHRTFANGGPVELVADAPAEEDWDALLVNRSGAGRLGIDFCGARTAPALHRDLCCFFPAGADSRLEFGGDAGSFVLYLRPGVIASLLESEGRAAAAAQVPILGKQVPRVAHLLGLIESELRRPSLGSRLMIDGLLRAIAGLIATRDGAPEPAGAERIYLSPPRLKRVIEFIEANLHESIGLGDLAEAAGLSANHFLRVFKLATGETPYHYLRNRRLERARRLLADDAIPLAQLALECGFANQAHFTAAFTRELGISPGRYRRTVRA
ncbi:helix-turn-helix domain-containing protein [Erythrobacter sp. NE805]|uniref:AraC family transcriptional regulator n=1 Tax=Erythrobacter sp. NE805 TaxID=3389875 RepID=UPI00396B3FB0